MPRSNESSFCFAHRYVPSEEFFYSLNKHDSQQLSNLPHGDNTYANQKKVSLKRALSLPSPPPFLRTKLVWPAQAWISVPSTLKCSPESQSFWWAMACTSLKSSMTASC